MIIDKLISKESHLDVVRKAAVVAVAALALVGCNTPVQEDIQFNRQTELRVDVNFDEQYS